MPTEGLNRKPHNTPATAGAVYLAQDAGNPDPDGKPATADSIARSQFLKFQTDTTNLGAPLQQTGEQNWVDGRVFAQTLGPEVKTVRQALAGSYERLCHDTDVLRFLLPLGGTVPADLRERLVRLPLWLGLEEQQAFVIQEVIAAAG